MDKNTTIRSLKLCRHYLWLILFSIVFLVYGLLLRKHYALDTYVWEANGNQGDQQIEQGRFLAGTILKMFTAFGVNTAAYQSYFTFSSLCLLALSIYLLIRLFSGLREEWGMKSFLFLCLSCLVSLCNVFMLHWFLFPEVVIFMMTGLVLSISAVLLLRDSGTAARWILCYGLLLAAISFYQAVGAIFVTFGMLHIALRRAGQSLASILRGVVSVFTVYVLAGATNILFIMWHGRFEARTDFHQANPLKNISGIIGSLQDKLHNTHLGVTPIYAFSLFMFFLLIGCGLMLWKSSNKRGLSRLLFLLTALILGSFIATIAPHLLTSTVDVSPRSIVALMCLPGVISLFVFLQLNLSNKPLSSYFLFVFLLLFFSVNTYISYRVETSRFATNRLDREIAGTVYQEILRHEKETGQTVSRIAFRHDEAPTLCYPGLICYGNFRAMGRDWTIVPLMSIVSGRKFSEARMPDMIYDSFFSKDWDSFSKEQIMIQDDILYLMLY